MRTFMLPVNITVLYKIKTVIRGFEWTFLSFSLKFDFNWSRFDTYEGLSSFFKQNILKQFNSLMKLLEINNN